MPRPHKCRHILAMPDVCMFKPVGVPAEWLETVSLRLDEVEALRLADLEGLYQEEAAARMGVSRATFARLVTGARRKVAAALLETKALIIDGGNVKMATTMRQFACTDCGHTFAVPCGTGCVTTCPTCASQRIHRSDGGGCHGGHDHPRGNHGHGHGHGGGGHGHGRGRCQRRRQQRHTARAEHPPQTASQDAPTATESQSDAATDSKEE